MSKKPLILLILSLLISGQNLCKALAAPVSSNVIRYELRKEDRAMDNTFKLTIDRFEGSWAILEYREETFEIPRDLLPADAKEGDVLTLNWHIDTSETEQRRQRIDKLMDDLFI